MSRAFGEPMGAGEFYRPGRPFNSGDSAAGIAYTRKNEHPACQRQGRIKGG
jgi:hypothetical protein